MYVTYVMLHVKYTTLSSLQLIFFIDVRSAFEFYGAVFKGIGLLPNFVFFVVWDEILLDLSKAVHRPWDHFQCSAKRNQFAYELLLRSWFLVDLSLLCIFLYILVIYL